MFFVRMKNASNMFAARKNTSIIELYDCEFSD